jgi:hypothetical protein
MLPWHPSLKHGCVAVTRKYIFPSLKTLDLFILNIKRSFKIKIPKVEQWESVEMLYCNNNWTTRGVRSLWDKLGGFPARCSHFALSHLTISHLSLKITSPLESPCPKRRDIVDQFHNDLENIQPVEIPTNPNINIELARFCMYLSHKSRWLYHQK